MKIAIKRGSQIKIKLIYTVSGNNDDLRLFIT